MTEVNSMRTLILVIILTSSIAIKAQTYLPIGSMDYMQREPFGNNTHSILKTQNKKWFLSTYSGISGSFVFLMAAMQLFLLRRWAYS